MFTNPTDVENPGYDINFFAPGEEISDQSAALDHAKELSLPGNPDDFAFPMVLASAKDQFVWREKDSNGQYIEKVKSQNIIALKGCIIKLQTGYSLFDGAEKVGICQTVSSVAQMSGKVKPGSYPIIAKAWGPAQFARTSPGEDKPALNPEIVASMPPGQPSRETLRFSPVGSRGKSCEECVAANEHIYFNESDTSKPFFCRSRSRLIMAVFAVGVRKSELDPNTQSVVETVEWVNCPDAVDYVGRPLFDDQSPVQIISIPFNRTQATISKSRRRFLPKTAPEFPINQMAMTLSQYQMDALQTNKVVARRLPNREEDDLIWMEPVSITLTPPVDTFAQELKQVGYIPMVESLMHDVLFTDESGQPSQQKIMSTLQASWTRYYNIIDAGKNAATAPTTQAVEAGAPQAQIAAASGAVAQPAVAQPPVAQPPVPQPAAVQPPVPQPAVPQPAAAAANQPTVVPQTTVVAAPTAPVASGTSQIDEALNQFTNQA